MASALCLDYSTGNFFQRTFFIHGNVACCHQIFPCKIYISLPIMQQVFLCLTMHTYCSMVDAPSPKCSWPGCMELGATCSSGTGLEIDDLQALFQSKQFNRFVSFLCIKSHIFAFKANKVITGTSALKRIYSLLLPASILIRDY